MGGQALRGLPADSGSVPVGGKNGAEPFPDPEVLHVQTGDIIPVLFRVLVAGLAGIGLPAAQVIDQFRQIDALRFPVVLHLRDPREQGEIAAPRPLVQFFGIRNIFEDSLRLSDLVYLRQLPGMQDLTRAGELHSLAELIRRFSRALSPARRHSPGRRSASAALRCRPSRRGQERKGVRAAFSKSPASVASTAGATGESGGIGGVGLIFGRGSEERMGGVVLVGGAVWAALCERAPVTRSPAVIVVKSAG
jgi:hypothetical protein